jgi:hypothetical protein
VSKAIKLYLYKSGDRLEFRPYQEDQYQAWVKRIEEGQTVEAKFKVNRPMKTLPQLGYYHAVMLPFAVESFLEMGHDVLYVASVFGHEDEEKTTVESMDKFFKSLYQGYKGLQKAPRKRDMSVDEFSEFIEFLLKWMAEKPGIYCPTPEDR